MWARISNTNWLVADVKNIYYINVSATFLFICAVKLTYDEINMSNWHSLFQGRKVEIWMLLQFFLKDGVIEL